MMGGNSIEDVLEGLAVGFCEDAHGGSLDRQAEVCLIQRR